MPSFVKTAPVDEDHVLIPAFEFLRCINGEAEIVVQSLASPAKVVMLLAYKTQEQTPFPRLAVHSRLL